MNAAIGPEAVTHGGDAAKPLFFAVSVMKLVVLSVCTLGLYQVFWLYKNWSLVRLRERSNILPVARAIFGYFFCYSLFARIRDEQQRLVDSKRLPAMPLAVGWIVVTFLGALPNYWWPVGLASVSFIVPVQLAITRINTALVPDHDPNSRFTAVNWATIAIGSAMLVLAIIGSILEPNAA